jgi:hypothetical protein
MSLGRRRRVRLRRGWARRNEEVVGENGGIENRCVEVKCDAADVLEVVMRNESMNNDEVRANEKRQSIRVRTPHRKP